MLSSSSTPVCKIEDAPILEDENDDENGTIRKGRKKEMLARVVEMLNRLIARFDTDDSRNRET